MHEDFDALRGRRYPDMLKSIRSSVSLHMEEIETVLFLFLGRWLN